MQITTNYIEDRYLAMLDGMRHNGLKRALRQIGKRGNISVEYKQSSLRKTLHTVFDGYPVCYTALEKERPTDNIAYMLAWRDEAGRQKTLLLIMNNGREDDRIRIGSVNFVQAETIGLPIETIRNYQGILPLIKKYNIPGRTS